MHTSLRLHPATIAWNSSRPCLKVIGPGGLDEGYPSQPPSLAMIQVAHLRLLVRWGFFCSFVAPSSSALSLSSTALSSSLKARAAGSQLGAVRACTSCMVVTAALAAMAVSL